jgi:hypothetical protein
MCNVRAAMAMDARALSHYRIIALSRCRGSRRSKDQRRMCALIQQALEDYPD